jgi:hypothetical protein
MRAFLSYQTGDKHVAAEIGKVLDDIGVRRFMAHDDIDVSHEWQEVIFRELDRAELFIAILSERYLVSPYCMQESGVAVFMNKTVIPLSLDGTTPPGFMAHIHGRRITPGTAHDATLFAGIAKFDREFAIEKMISRLGKSLSWDSAGYNLEVLEPYLEGASDETIVKVLDTARLNGEIANSFRGRPILTRLLRSHGNFLEDRDLGYLERACNIRNSD